MEEIIRAFGIDWRLIVIQMFNFAVLAGVLWYFLYTPVLNLLSEREAKLKKGVEDSEAARVALSQAGAEKSSILTQAQGEASEIVARASVHAEERGAEIYHEAEKKVARVLEDAKLKAEEIKAIARKESEAEVARAAILTAEKILNERLSS